MFRLSSLRWACSRSPEVLALYYTNGQNILQLGDYVDIGQGMIGPIPVPVILVILVTIVIWYVVNNTRYGRGIYAVGGNRSAAEASGINAKKSIYTSYVIKRSSGSSGRYDFLWPEIIPAFPMALMVTR